MRCLSMRGLPADHTRSRSRLRCCGSLLLWNAPLELGHSLETILPLIITPGQKRKKPSGMRECSNEACSEVLPARLGKCPKCKTHQQSKADLKEAARKELFKTDCPVVEEIEVIKAKNLTVNVSAGQCASSA